MEYVCGAMSTLDPYSRFLTSQQLDETFSNIEGNFVGLGVELKAEPDRLRIVNVIKDGPAEKAGVRAGDAIVAVDGTNTKDANPDAVADLLRGPEGSYVVVDFVTTGQQARSLKIQRERVEVPCVENVQIVDRETGTGYFRLTSFQKTTTRDVDDALWNLHRQGMQQLIIDLRGNPGGLLSAAVEVADRFIRNGRIVTTRGRNVRENYDYVAHDVNTWTVPLIVLIDGDSASASEIFAGAIRDQNRGTLIGQRTYGKGSVQGIFRMQSAHAGICLTTAKFYSPNNVAISDRGVAPHREIAPTYIVARPAPDGHIVAVQEDSILSAALEHARSARVSQRP
jgi:carboxyl-terminal processing protease